MTNVDTPDHQLGIVFAQAVLAVVPGGNDPVTVTVPPNAETIVVTVPSSGTPYQCTMKGVTTGIEYTGAVLTTNGKVTESVTYLFDCSSALDSQVTITLASNPTGTWYVSSDAAAHVVVDASVIKNVLGQPYVIPTIPNVASGDHPPNELSVTAVNNQASGAVILAAPGTGKRYRVFSASIVPQGSAQYVALIDAVTSAYFIATYGSGGTGVAQMSFAPTGFPLTANAAVEIVTSGGNATCTVSYSIETL